MRADEPKFKVLEKRLVGPGTWVLRFERRGMVFKPGQHLSVSPPSSRDFREYSVYSGQDDDFLEILIKVVQGGKVSKQLAACEPGELLTVWGPIGFFTLPDNYPKHPLVFIATGTGISPFHSFVASHKLQNLDYTLVHGIKTPFGKNPPVIIVARKNLITALSRKNHLEAFPLY